MHQFSVERTIRAKPEDIWRVLTDAATLGSGPFGILRLDGTIAPGAKLKLWSTVAPNRAFQLTVTSMQPNRTIVWTGGMPLGLFTGTRTFSLEPQGDTTLFRLREVYDGPMTGLIWKSIPDLTPSFHQFAAALATAVETKP